MGVLAAFLWSVYALFLGEAGMPGMRMTFSLFPEPGSGSNEIYLEIAAALAMFILLGRYFEAHAKRRSGAALKALLDLGAKDLSLIHISEPTRLGMISYAVFCLKKKKK